MKLIGAKRFWIFLCGGILLLLLLLHCISVWGSRDYPEMSLSDLSALASEKAISGEDSGESLPVPGELPSVEGLPRLEDGLLETVSITLDQSDFTYAFYPLSRKLILLFCEDPASDHALCLELRVPYTSFLELQSQSKLCGRVESFTIVSLFDVTYPTASLSSGELTVLDYFTVGNCFGQYTKEKGFTVVSDLFFDESAFQRTFQRFGI